MKDHCKKNGIRQEFTIPHNPEQNGMAERANRTLVEMTRCMLQDSGMKKQYWGEAIKTAAYIRNMVSTSQHPENTQRGVEPGNVDTVCIGNWNSLSNI